MLIDLGSSHSQRGTSVGRIRPGTRPGIGAKSTGAEIGRFGLELLVNRKNGFSGFWMGRFGVPIIGGLHVGKTEPIEALRMGDSLIGCYSNH